MDWDAAKLGYTEQQRDEATAALGELWLPNNRWWEIRARIGKAIALAEARGMAEGERRAGEHWVRLWGEEVCYWIDGAWADKALKRKKELEDSCRKSGG